jgi:hypothetical protein
VGIYLFLSPPAAGARDRGRQSLSLRNNQVNARPHGWDFCCGRVASLLLPAKTGVWFYSAILLLLIFIKALHHEQPG